MALLESFVRVEVGCACACQSTSQLYTELSRSLLYTRMLRGEVVEVVSLTCVQMVSYRILAFLYSPVQSCEARYMGDGENIHTKATSQLCTDCTIL